MDAMSALNAFLLVAGPTGGGFLGSWGAFYIYCPNRRCCQLNRVHCLLEKTDDPKEGH